MTDEPQLIIHPRLRRHRDAIAQHLGLSDPAELDAALDDIATLLHRCGYHLRYSLAERAAHLARKRRSRSTCRSTAQRKGRKAGSANWAARQLGLGLATIWFEQCGAAPTRRIDAYGSGKPHGPYRDFVATIWALLPERARPQRKGHVPDVDHFVRVSIEAFNDARASADESQRRGLLPEATWNRE